MSHVVLNPLLQDCTSLHLVTTQVPEEHLVPGAQALPQEPQLALSVCRSLHVTRVEPHKAELGAAQGHVVVVLDTVVVVVVRGVVVVVSAGLW